MGRDLLHSAGCFGGLEDNRLEIVSILMHITSYAYRDHTRLQNTAIIDDLPSTVVIITSPLEFENLSRTDLDSFLFNMLGIQASKFNKIQMRS